MALNSYRAAKVFSIYPFFHKEGRGGGPREEGSGEVGSNSFFYFCLESYPEAAASEREGANWRPQDELH